MVRRSIDNAFMPLGQLVKVYGRTAPFMAAILMEPMQPQPPPVPTPVEIDQFRIQQQPQQRMVAPSDINGFSMMTPEQQILLLDMRYRHQRPTVPDPYALKPPSASNAAPSVDIRRLMSAGANEFFQTPVPANVPPAVPIQEMDPIQQLLMQLQKTGANGSANEPQQWIKPSTAPAQMIPTGGGNLDMLPTAQVINQQSITNAMHQNQGPSQNNWNQVGSLALLLKVLFFLIKDKSFFS